MPTIHLTAEAVNKLPLLEAGQELYRDTKLQGFGLRIGSTSKAYFAEKRVDGRTVRATLGMHGQITADQARKAAVIALGKMTNGDDLNAEKREKARKLKSEKSEKRAAAEYTLEKLCDWYVTHQEGKGKTSARDAKNLFKNHVKTSEFASLPARSLTAKQATAIIRAVVEKGHARTAAKLRAYLRAAYALAQGAETNPEAPAALLHFGVETNPVASTGALSSANNTRDMVLTQDELGECMRLLAERREKQYDDALAAFELSILLGGQRIAQVLRLTLADVDQNAGTITLFDPKGRRKTARRHVLPLTNTAKKLVEVILEKRRADWLFGDKSAQTVPDTVARKGSEVLRQAQENLGEADLDLFAATRDIQVRDLRRTAETVFAAMGISKDLRAQIQSHGLGGVQDRHYDRHDYMGEKLRALEAWATQLQALAERKPAPTNVRLLRGAKAAV